MRIQQFNVNRQLQIRFRHLFVSKCNQRVEYEASHHFRGCSPGLVDDDVVTMETQSRLASNIDAPNSSHCATIYITNKSSSQATYYINNTTE